MYSSALSSTGVRLNAPVNAILMRRLSERECGAAEGAVACWIRGVDRERCLVERGAFPRLDMVPGSATGFRAEVSRVVTVESVMLRGGVEGRLTWYVAWRVLAGVDMTRGTGESVRVSYGRGTVLFHGLHGCSWPGLGGIVESAMSMTSSGSEHSFASAKS